VRRALFAVVAFVCALLVAPSASAFSAAFFSAAPKTLVCDGDSITKEDSLAGPGEVPDPTQRWCARAARAARGHPRMLNVAVSGSYGSHWANVPAAVRAQGKRVVYVYLTGVNGINSSGKTGAQVLTDIAADIAAVRADGVTEVVIGTMPSVCFQPGKSLADSTKEGYRVAANAGIVSGLVGQTRLADYAADATLAALIDSADDIHPPYSDGLTDGVASMLRIVQPAINAALR